jgi:hypothetical protein
MPERGVCGLGMSAIAHCYKDKEVRRHLSWITHVRITRTNLVLMYNIAVVLPFIPRL